ncbi:MAG TPA: polysaccharide deacetylase family protein [Candidatus Limnocylindrales bacterium]|nr:polysaccharide deacetylase family protein [Candidatus Limnocylindrales bacterium]
MLAIVATTALVVTAAAVFTGPQAHAVSAPSAASPTTVDVIPVSTGTGPTAASPAPPTDPPPTGTPAATPPERTPLPTSSPAATFPPLADGVVPILYLHRVEATPAGFSLWPAERQQTFLAYDVLPSAFEAQLDWLQAHGYTTILPRDLARHWDEGTALPPRPVIISLDDGFRSWNRTVLPMLVAHHMVAEFYLTIDAITVLGRLTWDDVRALARAGNGIGAHDIHHVQLAGLGADRPPASVAEMWEEIHEARVIIGQEVGVPPDSMAYVGGGFDATLVSLVRRAGYTSARSVLRGIDQTPGHRFTLRVVRIGPRDDVVEVVSGELAPGLPVFAAKMAGAPS